MTEVVLTCANHPNRETSLRCKRCNKPICSSCAVLTPVGYRCRECVRGQQATFDTAGVGALVVGAGAAQAQSPAAVGRGGGRRDGGGRLSSDPERALAAGGALRTTGHCSGPRF